MHHYGEEDEFGKSFEFGTSVYEINYVAVSCHRRRNSGVFHSITQLHTS